MAYAINILVAYKTGYRIFGNNKCDLARRVSCSNRGDDPAFAMSVQSNSFRVDVGPRSKEVNCREGIVGKIIVGRRLPIASRTARPAFVVSNCRDSETCEPVCNKAIRAPVSFATTAL